MRMRVPSRLLLLLPLGLGLTIPALCQDEPAQQGVSIFAREPAETLEWDARVVAMEAGGELQRIAAEPGSLVSGWFHERFQQHYRGFRVFGAQLLRHWHGGRVVLVNGRYQDGINLDTSTRLGPEEARLVAERAVGHGARAVAEPELLVYPSEAGPVLAYKLHVRAPGDLYLCFVDAVEGSIVDRWSDLRRQMPAIGEGIGTWGDTKKMGVTEQSGTYAARDESRPAVVLTADAGGNYSTWSRNQINANEAAATDSDNLWEDGAVVDAHAYAGWTYDYYRARFNRKSLNGSDGNIVSYVHYALRSAGERPELNNTFWDPTDRSANYGDGDGRTFNYFSSALDIVVHELSHGVSMFTADFIYRNQPGALGESFSDIMGLGAEFLFEEKGSGRQRSEWLIGEDLYMNNFGGSGTSAFRSASNPAAYGHPDHYSNRYEGTEDNGGVHINSTIPTHAFYLFVEGGTNRTSGIKVGGIGFENIADAEEIFYRGFTRYLGPNSNFGAARDATLQAARDLHGGGSKEVTQLTAAWDAVGVR